MSFSVGSGVFGLLGHNGAGKSTLMRALVTVEPPNSGAIQVCGFDTVRQGRAVRRRLGYLPQELPILVVDEPTAGLDPEERVRFRGVLSRYARQGRTVLLSTHIVEDVHQLCQHLAVLRKGRLFYAGPSQKLLHQVEGRVKVLPLGDDRELAALQRQAVVLSTTYEQNAILARVVDESGRFPQPPVPATLEDAYVY